MNNIKREQDYLTASALSFAGHKDRAEIQLKDGVGEIPLGFQPYGINSQPLAGGGDRVAVADYFAPAVCTFDVWVADGTLAFENVAWIHGAQNGITRCRGGFPDIAQPAGANRCVTAFWGPDDSVWIGRGEREFFVLSPTTEMLTTAQEKRAGVGWVLSRRTVLPPADEFPCVFSAGFIAGKLYTVESNNKLDSYQIAQYEVIEGGRMTAGPCQPSLVRSGGVVFTNELVAVTVTNVEVANDRKGVYFGFHRVLPEVSGTGICPLSNGGALVARYGQEAGGPFKGVPGALLYIPPALLSGLKWLR